MKARVDTFIKDADESLQSKSQIVYIYPAIPSVIVFIVSIISASIYITKRGEHDQCTFLHPSENDYLRQYVLGSIIVGYIFLAIYSNILIEYIPQLKGLGISFFLLFTWGIGCFVWNIIGATLVQKSYCTDTSYYGIAVLNLVIYFVAFGGLIIYSLVVWIRSRLQQKHATQVNPAYAQNNEDKDK